MVIGVVVPVVTWMVWGTAAVAAAKFAAEATVIDDTALRFLPTDDPAAVVVAADGAGPCG